ncbi:Hypoticical protein [Pectobacterium parmentieri]|uniref:Hypoticical protein n=1 Tax=Pectobacterium parmentieri TaxID=1905730 RepID=A0A0H3I332_PECPM|nr:Hypoticical protein [Pectobacterium parmentieri]
MNLRETFRIIAYSAQLLAHFLVEITVCAMDAVFSRGLRNFLLKFGLSKI